MAKESKENMISLDKQSGKELCREVEKLFDQQMSWWGLARHNHLALDNLKRRSLSLSQANESSLKFALQYNPERQRSAAAPTGEGAAEAPCVLCPENQPPEQIAVAWKTSRHEYRLQLNPYPILRNHLTIKDCEHVPQRLTSGRLDDMVKLSAALPQWLVFFNGARCGASAPGHFHFQAGLPADVPLCQEMAMRPLPSDRLVYSNGEATVGILDTAGRFGLVGCATNPLETHHLLDSALLAVAKTTGDDDPTVNVMTWMAGRHCYFALFPRRQHRPSCYGEGEGQRLVSPATLEMAGLWPVAREEDYEALTAADLCNINREVCVDTATAVAIVSQLKTIL